MYRRYKDKDAELRANKIDNAKRQIYGAQPGDPTVQSRFHLDSARTVADSGIVDY